MGEQVNVLRDEPGMGVRPCRLDGCVRGAPARVVLFKIRHLDQAHGGLAHVSLGFLSWPGGRSPAQASGRGTSRQTGNTFRQEDVKIDLLNVPGGMSRPAADGGPVDSPGRPQEVRKLRREFLLADVSVSFPIAQRCHQGPSPPAPEFRQCHACELLGLVTPSGAGRPGPPTLAASHHARILQAA